MGLQKEIWINDIVGNLFKANPHLDCAMNADGFVLAGKVVHIPNAGDKPGVERNRAKLPATIVKRQDVDVTFALDEFTSDPVRIDDAEKYELSYSARDSIMSEQKKAISELVGDWFFQYWRPGTFVSTTGSNVKAHVGTGNRKAVTLNDVRAASLQMDKWNVPREGRVAILDADMFDQLTGALSTSQYRDFSSSYNQGDNILGRLYGFDMLPPRADVLRFSNANTPVVRTPGSTSVADTDFACALFWQKDMVIRAFGEHSFFSNEGDATVYGDVYSALLRCGGRKKRNDGKGVVGMIQSVGV